MSQTNLELIQSFYACFARGDAPAALALMAPGIVWNEAENFPYADRNPYTGPIAIAEGLFFRLATEWDGFQVLPRQFIDGGDIIVVLGRYKGAYKATGVSIDAQFAHVYTLQSGRITSFQQYTDTAQASRAVRGR
jgi:ketosteroid isomerase-like protein